MTDATVARVARPRGELTPDRRERLERLAEKADAAKAELRAESVQALVDGGSFAWVSKATGLSTNTLQRWKREAGK